MLQLLLLMVAAGMALANAGCSMFTSSNDPNTRMEQLLITEDVRQIEVEGDWRHGDFTTENLSSHLTPVRVHGSLGP